jgi:hypothetical protein
MRNQAVALSKMDFSRVVLGEDALNVLNKLCEHSFMVSKIKLTEPARRKHEDLQILLQYMILRFKPGMGFSGAEIMNLCDDIKSGEITIPLVEIRSVMDYLDSAYNDKRQYLKKVHVSVVMFAAQEAVDRSIDATSFGKHIDGFFANIESNDEFQDACKSGSAKRSNVQTRVKLMMETLDNLKAAKPTQQKQYDW